MASSTFCATIGTAGSTSDGPLRRVSVRYFALLREQAGRGSESLQTAARTPQELYEQLQREHAERTKSAVRRARARGTGDPMQLFLAGARGYLDVCIEQRELAALFVRGDGPPNPSSRARTSVS